MMDCIFCKIINGEIPSKKVYEDDDIFVFYDINAQAPIHLLFIPKKHISSTNEINENNSHVISKIFEKIPLITQKLGLESGYRIISNCGSDAAQTIEHLHFHVLGGIKLSEKMV